MKTEDLKAQGLTDEQISFVMAENGKDLKKLQKENENLTADRDVWKEKAETAEETLKGFEGIDVAQLQTEVATWKQKAKDIETEYETKTQERNVRDKVNEKLSAVKMQEDMKDFIFDEILKTGVSLNKNGELIGFDEGLKSVKEKRPSAFVDEEQENAQRNAAHFGPVTAPRGQQTPPGTMTKKDIMAIKDPGERQAKIAENIGLFTKG